MQEANRDDYNDLFYGASSSQVINGESMLLIECVLFAATERG